MEVSIGRALRQWQNGSTSEVLSYIHTLSHEAARAPAKAWTVASRFPFETSARDSCSTRGHSAWSRCHPSSVAATAPLKQTVALQYPDRYIASAPVTSRSGGRRGRRSQSPWELPSPRLQPSSSKGALPRRPEIGSPCPVVRSGPTSIWWGDTHVHARLFPGPTSRRQECETPFKQTPRADMERQGQRAPEAARVARLQPRHRHNGKAEACHVCQARHAKVHASSHVLIGERGRTRASTRASCSDVVSQNGLKPWPERALHRSDHWS